MPRRDKVRRIARQEGVDPPLLRALIRQESGNNRRARSPAGAIGRTQLMPGTARGLGVNPYNDTQNVRGGARYLRQQLDRFGNVRKALAAYNAGPGAVQQHGGVPPYAETQTYVRNIMSDYRGRRTARGVPGGRAGRQAGRQGAQRVTYRPGRTELRRVMDFDQAGFEQAERRAQVGAFLARSRGTDSVLFRSGLLTTTPPSREDFTDSRLQSKIIPGRVVGTNGDTGAGDAAPPAAGRRIRGAAQVGQIDELFYDPLGGFDRPQGSKKVHNIGPIGGHGKHAHLGGDPELMLTLGKAAKRMGLAVRENPAFDPVDPVHTKGSLHYQSERVRTRKGRRRVGKALDVSGDQQLLAAFVRRVMREFDLR